jgi:DNA-binding SARP family transcriptional activator
MGVRALGPVEASADGRSILVGGGKPRALLAMLALNAGSARGASFELGVKPARR